MQVLQVAVAITRRELMENSSYCDTSASWVAMVPITLTTEMQWFARSVFYILAVLAFSNFMLVRKLAAGIRSGDSLNLPPRPKATADRRQHTPTARGEDASAPHIEPFGYREYGPIMFLRMGGSSWVVASSTSAADAFLRGKDLTICSCSCSPTISGTSRERPTDRIGVT